MLHRLPDQNGTNLQPLVLACFGRGGSNLVYSALAASAGTVAMRREWHQAVFANAHWVRRGLRALSRHGLGHRLGAGDGLGDAALRGVIRTRVLADLRRNAPWTDAAPEWLVIKLMDHNIIRLPALERALGPGRTICLTRAPLPQCESLMRSGLSVDEACRWYNDVGQALARLLVRSTVIRFESLIATPLSTLDGLAEALGLPRSQHFYLKDKSFGAARTATTDVDHAAIRAIPRDALAGFVKADVNERAIARLDQDARRRICDLTAGTAAQLGYRADAY